MVAIILGRDAFLVVGAFAARARALGWRWPGASEFFRVAPPPLPGSGGGGSGGTAGTAQQPVASSSGDGGGVQAAPFVQPLYISKVGSASVVRPFCCSLVVQSRSATAVHTAPCLAHPQVNTAFQLGLVAACISKAWLGWPGEEAVWWAAAATAGTTVASTAAYVHAYLRGRVLAPPATAQR